MAWETYCFEFGDAESDVSDFFEGHGYDIRRIGTLGGIEKRLFEPSVRKRELREAVRQALQPNGIVLAFHSEPHLAYALAKLADTLSDKFCYIHISHDNAWNGHYHETVRRSHFIPQLLHDTNARGKKGEIRLVTIGSFNNIFTSVSDRELREGNNLEKALAMAPQDAYVLVDSNVLAPSEFSAGGIERGTLTRQELLDVLRKVKSAKEILGASIVVHGVTEERNGIPVFCAPEKDLMLYKEAADLLAKEAVDEA